MSDFNLIDEGWISVVTDYKGTTRLVGLKEFFENAHNYIGLAGDMPTQDFALMRFLLAILHTVFSRYDAKGEPYEMVELDQRMRQVEEVDDEDAEEYEDALLETWQDLWKAGKFPQIVCDYLEAWRDRFYLFDDQYPFYQLTKEQMTPDKISKTQPSEILGKNMNRTISESGNKVAIFSPRYASRGNKDQLTLQEAVRWLITYQSYTGLSDKVIFGKEKYKSSKGWLFDLGGVYLSSSNLYKTLLLNLQLINYSNPEFNQTIEKPCWEYSPSELLEKYLASEILDNIAELYTAWSRGICIDKVNPEEAFSMDIIKIPEIRHTDQFLEAMTIWRFNDSGENKGKFTPRKHQLNKAMWRSFGLITKNESMDESKDKIPKRKPGIIDWLNHIEDFIQGERVQVNAISMEDDGNATSWVPTNEITDEIRMEESVLNDTKDLGWVNRINDVVEETKEVVDKIYRGFINDIKKIRNIDSKDFTSKYIEEMYYQLDKPFRDWLENINYQDNKDEKIQEWLRTLKKLVIYEAEKMLKNSGTRDYIGITEKESVKNIATAFNQFMFRLNKKL